MSSFVFQLHVRKYRMSRESEERFRSVFESASECIYIIGTNLKYTHVNPASSNLFGIPASEFIGLGPAELYGEEIGKQILEINSRVLRGERVEHQQVRLVRGTPVTFRDILVPLKDAQDKIVGICCLSRYEASSIGSEETLATDPRGYPSPAMQNTFKVALSAARGKSVVLLQGESGSGKDYLARWIHDHSPYASGSFISVNCAALPMNLAESELFGHERGAFTGATVKKKGQLEMAEGGTILLNEIGELDLALQAKLLTFLDTSSFLRVGGQRPVKIGARIIAASHRDLENEVSEGRFLNPLFHRLNVLPIVVPPLRERIDDLPALTLQIIKKVAEETQRTELPTIEERHLQELSGYHWPGNVRELRNVLERSMILWQGGPFSLDLVRTRDAGSSWSHVVTYHEQKTLRDVIGEVEYSLCSHALALSRGNRKEAAARLGISRDSLYRCLKKMEKKGENPSPHHSPSEKPV